MPAVDRWHTTHALPGLADVVGSGQVQPGFPQDDVNF